MFSKCYVVKRLCAVNRQGNAVFNKNIKVFLAVQCSAVQFSALKFTTVWFSQEQCSAVQHRSVQCSAVQ